MVGALGAIEQLDEFEILSLSVHDVALVGRVGHPLTVTGDVTLGDVFGYPLVGPGLDSDASELLVGLAGAATEQVTPPTGAELLTIECDSSDVLKRLLVESDALTLMPRFVVDDDVRHERLAIIAGVDLGLRVRFGAAWLRGRSLGGAGSTFLDLLRAHDEAWSVAAGSARGTPR